VEDDKMSANTNLRIAEHPILNFSKEGTIKVHITVNGKEIEAYEGEPIASAILASGIKVLRRTPKLKSPRSLFCAIGRCSDCVMTVNGTPSIRTCVTPVEDGMIVESQDM
jgi:predicted molibdopterin-dependent oxidoreductase YjgC